MRLALGPASLSIRLVRLAAVTAAERNTENQKFGHSMAFLVDGLLTTGLAPQNAMTAIMWPNAPAEPPQNNL